MCGECFVCLYLVCQCDGLELVTRNRRITVGESRLGLTVMHTSQPELSKNNHFKFCISQQEFTQVQ